MRVFAASYGLEVEAAFELQLSAYILQSTHTSVGEIRVPGKLL